MSKMLEELKDSKEHGEANGEAAELPEGSSPLEAREDATENAEETSEEASGESATSETPVREEKSIIIGGKEFKSEAEALAYAEQLADERDKAELYAQGVRDTLAQQSRPAQQQEEPEDDFDQKFYANPKEALKEVEARATRKALEQIEAVNTREKLWTQFLSENPDIRRKDAERVLQENSSTIGNMTDVSLAMKKLAQKVRAEYEEIRDLAKPRTELKRKENPGVSPSGGSRSGVTPQKKDDRPLSFVEEMRRSRLR